MMISRRTMVIGGGALLVARPVVAVAQDGGFAALLAEIERNPADNLAARADVEGRALEATRGPAPRSNRSNQPISADAIRLIVASEVTGQRYYEQRLRAPTLPPAPSGITIGIGYDLGYTRASWVDDEWSELPAATRQRLKAVCGRKGVPARAPLAAMRDIQISWDVARAQFQRVLLPLYVGETLRALPNVDGLLRDVRGGLDCLGALVDLVFNRGAGGFASARPRYVEMRRIAELMRDGDFAAIPDQLDTMARHWAPGSATPQPGNVRRRHAEAALFRQGLAA